MSRPNDYLVPAAFMDFWDERESEGDFEQKKTGKVDDPGL